MKTGRMRQGVGKKAVPAMGTLGKMSLLLFFWGVMGMGCRPSEQPINIREVRYQWKKTGEPSIILFLEPKPRFSTLWNDETLEDILCFPLSQFEVSTREGRNTLFQSVTHRDTKAKEAVGIRLCRKEPDPLHSGNLLMDWEIEFRGTCHPVSHVSWNQKTPLFLWAGPTCAVFLGEQGTSCFFR